MLEGVGTRVYQGVTLVAISRFKRNSTKTLATLFLPHPEIATSLAELLSTKHMILDDPMIDFQTEKASTIASNSASKMIVLLDPAPSAFRCSADNSTEKKATLLPSGFTKNSTKTAHPIFSVRFTTSICVNGPD